jgi:hypothetical protein
MYFSLTSNPVTFQTMMNKIFQDLITEGVVSVYLNDILIFTSSIEEHHCMTHLVLDRMREHKLYLRPEKYEFEKLRLSIWESSSHTIKSKWMQLRSLEEQTGPLQ